MTIGSARRPPIHSGRPGRPHPGYICAVHHARVTLAVDVHPTGPPGPPSTPSGPAPTPPVGHRGLVGRLVRGRPGDPVWVRPSLLALLAATAVLYLLGPRRLGLGQRLLLGRRPGREHQLEGLLLRLVRRLQLHHCRQAAGLVVGDGAVSPNVRGQRLERPGAAGPRRVWPPSAWSMPRYGGGSPRRPACWPARRWRSHRWPRHVPLQQPRRPAGAGHDRGGLCHGAGGRAGPTRWLVLAGALVGFGFITKLLQAFLVLPAFLLLYLVCAPTSFRRRSSRSPRPAWPFWCRPDGGWPP